MQRKSRDYGKKNNLNLRIVIGLARNHLSLERVTSRLLKSYQLTLAQFSVLETLYHLGDLKIGQLIEKTLTTAGNMTVVVKNLEKGGFIHRYNDPEDRRSSLIGLTPKGGQIIAEVFPYHLDSLHKELSRLSSEEKKQLVFLLKKMSGVEKKEKEIL